MSLVLWLRYQEIFLQSSFPYLYDSLVREGGLPELFWFSIIFSIRGWDHFATAHAPPPLNLHPNNSQPSVDCTQLGGCNALWPHGHQQTLFAAKWNSSKMVARFAFRVRFAIHESVKKRKVIRAGGRFSQKNFFGAILKHLMSRFGDKFQSPRGGRVRTKLAREKSQFRRSAGNLDWKNVDL